MVEFISVFNDFPSEFDRNLLRVADVKVAWQMSKHRLAAQQIFAAPISACAPAPDPGAREQISDAAGRAGKRLGDPRRAPEKSACVL